MNERETGGPAFSERRNDVSGMTLRDYFAVKALPLVWADIRSEKAVLERPDL